MNKNNRAAKNLVIVTLVIAALLVLITVLNKMAEKPNPNLSFENKVPVADQPTLGDSKAAKVSIVEFGDFKCPTCKAWGEQIFPRLARDYIDPGKVSFSYINVLFHGEESKLAALAAESVFAQDPQAYWTFHKELFHAQPQQMIPWVTKEKLLDIAKTFTPQIDQHKLEDAITTQTTMPQVNQDAHLVEQYQIQSTPTIMINGTVVADPFNYDQITAMIAKGLGE